MLRGMRFSYMAEEVEEDQKTFLLPTFPEGNALDCRISTEFEFVLCLASKMYHRIDLLCVKVCKVPPQLIPFHYRDMIKQTMRTDGSLRIYVDYRELNKLTKKCAYPLPVICEIQSKLTGCFVFSCLDLKSGYWHIPLLPQHQELTAFSFGNEFGLLQFTVMPFGLTEPPGTFQMLMNNLTR
ncbi:hypothetical protein RF11_02906 [Thelohanellus kitauei]|uniref:Reverse transcriptase domain-containing protein n=1 Tax=Thelohanellus kitauei TaxID=669202 RepID=A0A0C2JPT5_THEKT|nr:hypothetical protein RF11_02906 [Thelohanellus kitauei]